MVAIGFLLEYHSSRLSLVGGGGVRTVPWVEPVLSMGSGSSRLMVFDFVDGYAMFCHSDWG